MKWRRAQGRMRMFERKDKKTTENIGAAVTIATKSRMVR